MTNHFIPRALIHQWSVEIGDHSDSHQAAFSRLLKEHRKLSKFVEENAAQLAPESRGVVLYLIAVILRMFELAGGKLRVPTWEQVRSIAERIMGLSETLLPLDENFPERVRQVGRAQPHLLDEALMALFERKKLEEGEQALSPEEAAKVFFILWVAAEALDQCWLPPKTLALDETYTYVHIEPDQK